MYAKILDLKNRWETVKKEEKKQRDELLKLSTMATKVQEELKIAKSFGDEARINQLTAILEEISKEMEKRIQFTLRVQSVRF